MEEGEGEEEEAVEVEERRDTSLPLCEGLVTLSTLPKSRWHNLTSLDVIKVHPLSHPHTLTSSLCHPLTPSHLTPSRLTLSLFSPSLHILTPSSSLPHTLTISHPHFITPSLPHAFISSPFYSLTSSHPHSFTPSLPHILTPSHPHSLTPSHPHTLTGAQQAERAPQASGSGPLLPPHPPGTGAKVPTCKRRHNR